MLNSPKIPFSVASPVKYGIYVPAALSVIQEFPLFSIFYEAQQAVCITINGTTCRNYENYWYGGRRVCRAACFAPGRTKLRGQLEIQGPSTILI